MTKEERYKQKQEYLDKEEIFSVHPEQEKILCKDCVFRKPDVKLKNSTLYGATNAFCEVYPDGSGKPSEVIWDGAPCEYHVSEEEE